MDVARGETADNAAGERQGNGERRGGALRHMLEGGYPMHGPIAVVTAARAQIHHQPRAARMRADARDTELGRTQRKRRSELGHPLQPKSDSSDFGRLKMPNLAKPEFGARGWRARECGKSGKGFLRRTRD